MSGQLITVHTGGLGLRTAQLFWSKILRQNNLDPNGCVTSQTDIAKLHYYFNEGTSRWLPRTVIMDSDTIDLDTLRGGQSGWMEHLIGESGQGSMTTYANGHYQQGQEIVNLGIEAIRKQYERCDRIMGVQFFNSVLGGCGSGTGSLALQNFRQYFPAEIFQCFLLNSHQYNNSLLQVYNSALCLASYTENAQMVHFMDNIALHRKARKKSRFFDLTFRDYNLQVVQACNLCTKSKRETSLSNSYDLRKIASNLIPFPRIHFLQTSVVSAKQKMSVLLERTDKQENYLTDTFRHSGRIYTGGFLAYGKSTTFQFQNAVKQIRDKRDKHIDWIADNYFTSLVETQQKQNKVLRLNNSANFREGLLVLSDLFSKMFRRRSFVYKFTQAGMDQMEFTEAESNLNDLASQYWTSQPLYDQEQYLDYY